MKLMEIRPALPDNDFFEILKSIEDWQTVILSDNGKFAYSIEIYSQDDRIYFLVKYGVDTRFDVLDKNTRVTDSDTLKYKTHLGEQFFGVIFHDYIFVSGRNNKSKLLFILKNQHAQLKSLKLMEAISNYSDISSRIKSISKVKFDLTNDMFIDNYLNPNFMTGGDMENLRSSSHTFNITMSIKSKIDILIEKLNTIPGQKYVVDMKDNNDDDIQLIGNLILKSTDVDISYQDDGYFHMEDVINALSNISP